MRSHAQAREFYRVWWRSDDGPARSWGGVHIWSPWTGTLGGFPETGRYDGVMTCQPRVFSKQTGSFCVGAVGRRRSDGVSQLVQWKSRVPA